MKLVRTCIGALAVAATAITALPATAKAGGRHGAWPGSSAYPCGYGGPCGHVHRHHGEVHRHWHGRQAKRAYRQGNGDAAAVILGLAGLAIVGGVIASQNRTLPHTADPNHRGGRDHYPPAPNAPGVITYDSTLEPWSPGWFRWCDARYRSFDPERGTYRGHDGRDHFCVPR